MTILNQTAPLLRSATETGNLLRSATETGEGNIEDSMYPDIVNALNDGLLPEGFRAVSHPRQSTAKDKPDIGIGPGGDGTTISVEVKLPSTLKDAFKLVGGKHQIGRYREDRPVLLTDGTRWWDVTADTINSFSDLGTPVVTFEDSATDDVSTVALTNLLATLCGCRVRLSLDSAVNTVKVTIASINQADARDLATGWKIVRESLGLELGKESLDGEVGELITFALIAFAISLDPVDAVDADTFTLTVRKEWEKSDLWEFEKLPTLMNRSLEQFKTADRRAGDAGILKAGGWVAIRSVAAWITSSDRPNERWKRLSDLWDAYLAGEGRQKKLGSWQTEIAVAAYQADQVQVGLKSLGYHGLHDEKVTVIDPCVGTGVYLQAVVENAVRNGPESANLAFNGVTGTDGTIELRSRLIGVDVSSTAVASTHIRLSAGGVYPKLFTVDTLCAGAKSLAERNALTLFEEGLDIPIVAAANAERNELDRWAKRLPELPPVIAVIGNPPYLRGGLDLDRYETSGWRANIYDDWLIGSGNGAPLKDLYVAFWAWAFELCKQPHNKLGNEPAQLPTLRTEDAKNMFGVVSFITNRSWITGKTTGPMRAWVQTNAASIQITDFGPGSRGGAVVWSKQPFPIQAGTAIVTIIFDPKKPRCETVGYQKGIWENKTVKTEDPIIDIPVGNKTWTPTNSTVSLLDGVDSSFGIVTGNDATWIRTEKTVRAPEGNTRFTVRHAYRAFDNRWVPEKLSKKAKRGSIPTGNEMPSSAEWRDAILFGPHNEHVTTGGFYVMMPVSSAEPGPGLHPTRHLPNQDWYSGRGGRVVRVHPRTVDSEDGWLPTPVPADYQNWAEENGLTGHDFWLYMIAAANHADYWTAGTVLAAQVAGTTNQTCLIEPPLTTNPDTIRELVNVGSELVDLWSLDTITAEPGGSPGKWRFANHRHAETITVHGRKVLQEWRNVYSVKLKNHPDAQSQRLNLRWSEPTATEYAKTVHALLRVRELADTVARVLRLEAASSDL